ncbi:ExeA family protein [Sulfuriferula nivalis]|uniref:MSHA biogenesis protein MshM n=1 Tax=Sulfuriferula nivalis TaxID=2675298 RepID=A0A809S3K9_9PROT|nr:AAA family ATPase [Sulfuriferula nivalis]BBP01378.1 MSHA biogenesis protein MshM [Sulfuriferula nivalis]
MYLEHFGLREFPFTLTPDTSYFLASPHYQAALNTLLIAIHTGEGFIKITGEVGTGKTLLCRQFLDQLETSQFITVYIPNPYLTPHSLMLSVADELGLDIPANTDQHYLLKAINLALLDFAKQEKQVIVCLDEAQAMPIETLEALRLLTNLETEKRKLLQIVLFGQPELDLKLQNDSIRQLNQRITFHYQLQALSLAELKDYVAHRLKIAEYQGPPLFTASALKSLHQASGGIPRLINILAHKAMMLSYGLGARNITPQQVRAAANDTPAARPNKSIWISMTIALTVVATAITWMMLR